MSKGWKVLKASFDAARQNGVLLYDIMTERFEITSILQRELMQLPGVFGELQKGTLQQPSVTKESVHYLSKTVAGKPLAPATLVLRCQPTRRRNCRCHDASGRSGDVDLLS